MIDMIKEYSTMINAFCNIIICFSISAFIVFVFGRKNSMMNSLPKWESTMVRIGLITICCGSLFNLLTLSTPPLSELILNIGLAIIFLWGAVFHFKYFVKK